MIELQTLLAFAAAATIILFIPGPTVMLVISQSMVHGKRAVIPLATGVFLGDLVAMTLSMLGLGVLLATSAEWFALFKWVGALYLIYLGITLWRSKPTDSTTTAAPRHNPWRLFRNAFVTTALNPKSIVFFIAFLPQFIRPAGDAVLQLMLLTGVFLILTVISVLIYANFAVLIGRSTRNPSIKRRINQASGTCLIATGTVTALTQRTYQP